MAQRTVTSACMPYERNWSQDVENGTIDLVLSSLTHTNAVWDLKAAVAPLCSGMIVDAHSSSPAAPVDGNHMHHKVTETRSQTSIGDTLSTSHPT